MEGGLYISQLKSMHGFVTNSAILRVISSAETLQPMGLTLTILHLETSYEYYSSLQIIQHTQ